MQRDCSSAYATRDLFILHDDASARHETAIFVRQFLSKLTSDE